MLVMSMFTERGGGSHVPIAHDALHHTIQGPPPWNWSPGLGFLLYRDPWLQPRHMYMFKLVHCEVCMAAKWAFNILLECFLVAI